MCNVCLSNQATGKLVNVQLYHVTNCPHPHADIQRRLIAVLCYSANCTPVRGYSETVAPTRYRPGRLSTTGL